MSFINKFNFSGNIPASKSLFNRYLILKSFEPRIQISGETTCEDVLHLTACLENLAKGERSFYCGDGGTTLRFLALRVSRLTGTFYLTGSERLFARPQEELIEIFNQLGIAAKIHQNTLEIKSLGWQKPADVLRVSSGVSSQFLTAVLLSSWNLDFILRIAKPVEIVSQAYFSMTLKIVKDCGLKLQESNNCFEVQPFSKVKYSTISVEADVSSAFVIAALGALYGQVKIKNWPQKSLQPDFHFLEILQNMGVELSSTGNVLQVFESSKLQGIKINLKNSPDLFPVLAVLCAFAEDISTLYGAPQLKAKESNRIVKISELLSLCHITHEVLADGLKIFPSDKKRCMENIVFSAENDHRLVMAAFLLKPIFVNLQIKNENAVKKSYPGFLSIYQQGFLP